ncbi:MAG: ABC transporter permease [Deinococcota bacterium]
MFIFFLALRHVKRRALQSSLTLLGVAVGVMVLVTALSLTNGFIDELISSTLQATPHVTLTSYDLSPVASDVVTQELLEQHPEVEAVSPYLTAQALVARRANSQLGVAGRRGFAQLLGVDPAQQQAVLDLNALQEHRDELVAGNTIVLGETLARSLGVFPGDEVLVADIDGRRREFEVVGTFRVGNELIDSVIAYVSLATLQDYANAEGQITGYHARVRDPQDAEQIGRELGRESLLLANSWQNIFGTLIEQLELQKALIGVVVFLIVIVAAMGIANILILTVSEKTEEIAILRALGASRRKILAVFTLEGLILGGGGTILGALLGLGLSLYFKFQPYPLPGDLYFITQLPVELQAFDFIWVCALSITTSVVAGVVPARRASGLEPAKILR